MTEQQQTTITRNTRLTIGVAITIFGGILVGLREQYQTAERIAAIQRDILELRKDLLLAAGDRWKGQDMETWVRLFAEMNPNLRVPDPARNK